MGRNGKGLLPYEVLLTVQFHELLNRLIHLMLEENRVVALTALTAPFQFRLGEGLARVKVMRWVSHQDLNNICVNS
jgi:hypothetical protein